MRKPRIPCQLRDWLNVSDGSSFIKSGSMLGERNQWKSGYEPHFTKMTNLYNKGFFESVCMSGTGDHAIWLQGWNCPPTDCTVKLSTPYHSWGHGVGTAKSVRFCENFIKQTLRSYMVPDITQVSSGRSKFKEGFSRHGPMVVWGETLQGDGDPTRKGESYVWTWYFTLKSPKMGFRGPCSPNHEWFAWVLQRAWTLQWACTLQRAWPLMRAWREFRICCGCWKCTRHPC